MRRLAGKGVALFLALLMLLTSMPLTTLAESVTSEPWGFDVRPLVEEGGSPTNAGSPSALDVVKEAAEQNATSGGFVELYSARVQTPQPIKTGDEFTYEIGYALYPAPRYIDDSGEPQPAFAQYEDVEITIDVPDGIVLLDASGNEYRDTYTISLGDQPITGGTGQTVTVSARMDGNGTVEDGTAFDKLGVGIAANVTVEGETVEFTHALPDANNASNVTNEASGAWKVEKVQKGNPSVSGEEVTLAWTIKIGKVADTDFTGSNAAYNTTGALNFEDFSLTDTLPTITGKDGTQYKPLRSSITAAGMEAVNGGAGETALTTSHYATTALTAGGGTDVVTPYYTEYTVTATYDKAAFVLPFGDEEDVSYENTVEMVYTLIGKGAETITDSAEGEAGYPTDGGTITVFEELQLGSDSEPVEYNAFYASLFPNGAEFEVYAAEDWDNDEPADGAKPVATLNVLDTEGENTLPLAPGTYYVVQTDAPEGTEMPANEGGFLTADVTSGGNVNLTFTNLVKDKGILEIDKINTSGVALPGAAFTLTASDDGATYSLGLDSNGHGVIVLPVGTYTLEETTVPSGYVKMEDVEITIAEGQTNNTYTGEDALVNYSNKGSLTITKKLTDGEYEGATGVDPSTKVSKGFTFNIYRATTEPVPIEGEPYKTATIAAGKGSVTVSDLDVVDEAGNPYYYIVVEAADDDARFVYDDAQIAFDFKGEGDGVYTTTASAAFTNVLLSKLTFKKNEQTLSGTKAMDGVTFEVRSGSADGTAVGTVTTADGGIATTKPLPIKDANGNPINYYIVETNVSDDYTTVYPDGNANAWGPITLSFAETTDKTSTPIVNRKHETGLTIKKTDQSGTAIQGATFTVQNEEGQYAVVSNGAVTWQAEETALTTNASGQIGLSGLANGTYTVTETSVPDAYLSTGSVTGADEGTASTEGALSGKVTLETLQTKTITFKNDKKPVLTFTKNVEGNVSGNFTFELYAAADGKPTGESLGSATVTDGGKASFTVDAAGTYFLKEASWPAGVIAPTLIHTESSTGVYVDVTGVYYGPYTLSNNNTSTQTITNTPNSGSLTINKLDAKTDAKLTGATFTVSVNTEGWSEELIGLLPKGFAKVGETAAYAMTTGATNANGQVTVGSLPIYNGDALIEYTVTEATAPENYLIDDAPQTAKLALAPNGTAYTASLTFNDPPMAKAVVTKTWYSQWEQDSGNKVDYALAGAQIAIFEEAEGALVQVGETQSTAADGTTTFDGLDGTKTYYVFELSNPNGLEADAEDKELAGSVENIVGKSAEEALAAYYGATLELGNETDNQAEANLVNVETYVQLTLNKWYQPEKNVGTSEKPEWIDDEGEEPKTLDRAKFHLYYCTLEEYEAAGRDIQTLVGSEEGMKAYLYSDYVYESGISDGAGPGAVVTGALPGGYVYWFNEFEAPAGFVTPEWPDGLSVAFVPDAARGNEISYEENRKPYTSMENDPVHGPGTIRYLQVMVDKIARPEEGDAIDLPNTTFELWLTDSTYTERVVRVAKFTTGVDLPETDEYMPGRGVSESIQMHKLYDEYPEYVTFHKGEEINGVQHGEYEAYFVLVETEWPANTTPQSYTYPLYIYTNSGNDMDDTLATLDNTYTKDSGNPIVNTLSQEVTVAIKKVGYSADDPNTTWPLAGAEITIYSDTARTQEVASGTTGADGLVYFTLDPTKTYYWKETIIPNGYEAVEPQSYAFTTPDYSNALKGGEDGSTDIEPIVTVKNVKYRTLQLAKENESGEQVVATLTITGKSDSGATVNKTVETKTEGYVEVELPAGTYTVAETKLEGRGLSTAEKAYFALINDNTTVTFEEDEAVKTLTFENPGRGTLTLTKTDDADEPMAGVQFQLAFKAFTAADLTATTAPAASAVTGNVQTQTGIIVSQQQLTTDENGEIYLENLVPGWYKLTELEGDANENYVLADPVVIKVTASNFGTALGNASATVTNTRMGYLNVEKAYEGGFAGSFNASAQKVTFKVYSDEACKTEVATFTVTGESAATPVALEPGTYYVKETTTGAWYTNYDVTYTIDVSGREDTSAWLPENGGAAEVIISADDDENNPVMVSFTNVGYLADLTFDKVDDSEPAQPVEGATFALYYGEGDAAKFYNNNGTWGTQANATIYTSDETGKVTIADIELPYDVVTGSDDMSGTFYIKELSAPDNYYADLETATAVTLKPGVHNTDCTGGNAIVNEKGVVITLTKYNKPYAVTEGREKLDGAEFTLYHMSASGSVKETFPAQATKDGQVQFVNLPQLKDGEYYAIQETKTPTGYLQDSLELYDVTGDTDNQITAENGYFRVATDKDVTLEAYNTPLGKIAILKYDYINTDQKPVGATFTATNDENDGLTYNGTLRTAQGTDEQALEGGYTLSGDHYVKDGVSYTIAYLTNVVPGTYTVVENTKPNGYLYTPASEPGDPWHTAQYDVEVANDGSTTVVVFANLPDPEDFTVNIDKSAEYLGEGDLLGEEYQAVEFTLSNFTSGTELPLENATLKDDTFSFTDKGGKAVEGVEWYVESVTIGAASYRATAYDDTPSTQTIYATLKVKDADGAWSTKGSYALTGGQTVTFDPNACQGIEIVYGNIDGKLDAGFTAGDVVLTVKARQPVDDETTVPVAKIGNTASISMTYDFGEIGAEAEGATRTKTDSASADVTVDEAPALPKASITKSAAVQDLNGKPISSQIVAPGQRLLYTITLTGESDEMMEDPILADTLPVGLAVVENGITAVASDEAGLTVDEVRQAGQSITVTTTGHLAKGETLTLTILADVLPTALLDNAVLSNTAYAFNGITVPKSADNEHGSSFTDEAGVLPSVEVPEAFTSVVGNGSGMAISATVNNSVASASGTNINKMVSVDGTNWAANESLLVAEKGGNIYYRITVSSSGSRVGNLLILDVLPYKGDSNGSYWGPTLTGAVSATHGAVYYSTQAPAETAETLEGAIDEDGNVAGNWTTDPTGAKAFLVVVDELPAGETVTLSYTTTAPETPEDAAYYQLAINKAYCTYDLGPSILPSADTKVTIMPDEVSLGDRVWVDENANGIQDAKETKVPGGTATFMLVPSMEGEEGNILYTQANEDGYYSFEHLNPAAPQGGTAKYFPDSGDVDYTSLMGSARATYQLAVTVPDGYRITTPSKTTVEERKGNDSDFALTGETIKFYIPAGGMDDTYDVGVIRERNLTIAKKGINGLNVAGAEFSVYGPYYVTPTKITADELVGTITTGADGRAAFTSTEETYLNAYAYYVVVETSTPEHYDAADLTASGTSVVSNPKPTVTGEGIEDGNYFVLAPFAGEGMEGAASDEVSVTNGYEATGELIIKGTKVLTGETLKEGDFSFTLTSADDAGFEGETVTNAADGSITFSAIHYTYADVQYLASDEAASHGHAYHYTVTEADGEEDGIVYDTIPREITVRLSDDDGDGKITVNVTVSVDGQASSNANGAAELLFTNAAEGQLSVTKTVVSNVEGDEDKTFTFTVELSNDDVDVNGTYKTTITEDGETTPGADLTVKDGKGSFTLTDGQTITIGGIPNGTGYTVTEKDAKQDGFTTTSEDSSGSITTGNTATAGFTNTHEVGGLTVKKAIDGNGKDADKVFTFTVTLEHATLPLNNNYGVQFMNVPKEEGETGYKATATFTLKGGEEKVLTGIPAGTEYTVTEADYTAEGYVTDEPTNATGTVVKDGAPEVAFTNTRKVGGLTVSKTVAGNDFDADKAFDITVTLTAPANVNLVGSYTGAQSGSINVAATQAGASWTETFNLKNGQSINFTGLPENTTYVVSEADYAAEGYVKTVSGTESGSIKAEATATVAYTNTRDTGDLVITKTVTGSGGEEEKSFDFTVTLKNDTVDLDKTYGGVTFNPVTEGDTHEVQATFALKHGESKTITGIPVGTEYVVAEADYTADGYTVTKTGDTGTIELEEGTATRPTFTAAFTNNRDVGNLQLTKLITGSAFELGTPNAPYSYMIAFELTPPEGMSLEDSYYAMQGSSGTTYLMERYETLYTWDGTVYISQLGIAPNETYTIYDLPAGTTYKVYELYKDTDKGETYPTYYDDLGFEEPVFTSGETTTTGSITGTIPGTEGANTVAVTVTNERNAGSLSVEKTVEGTGAQPEKEFTFTLQLTHPDGVKLKGTYPATINGTDTTVAVDEDGKATFTLKGGETITIKGIPDGTDYEVTEADYTADGYTVEKTGEEGTIADGETAEAAFTNTRKVGGLTVTKKTEGSGLEEGYPNTHGTYKITVDFTAPTNVTLTGTWTQGGMSGDVAATQDFELASDESVVFTGLPAGTTYTITETDYTPDGYEAAVFSPKTGVIPGEEGANSVTATVTNERNTGSLSVEKIVDGTGAQAEKVFTFTLQLTNTGVTLEGTYPADINGTDTTVAVDASGKATFTLKGGETITINGIPDGTAYEVAEADYAADGYTLAKTGAEGTIADGQTAEAAFTNTRNVGGLTVTKKTAGNGLDEPGVLKSFDITVTLTPPAGVTLVGTVDGTALPADGTVTEGVWSKTFTLAADEGVTFTGLPEGTAYTVSEEDYTEEGFITTITPETGSIEVADGATEAPTVEVTVTNTRNVGGLTIAKAVTGSGSSASDTFTFRLGLENDAVNVNGEYTMTYSDNGTPVILGVTDGEAEITLHGGQTALIEGIPVGTTYTVTELTVAGADAETGVADENGYVLTTSNGLTGTVTGTEDAYQAGFTNDRKVGDLTVTKAVEGNGEDALNALDAFEITVTFTAPTGVALTGEVNGAPVQASNTITLADGESVKFTGLPEGTAYEVTEADYAANGYEVSYDEYASGDIVARETASAGIATTVTNTMNVGDLSVTKTVTGSGAETGREFRFTLTLTNETGVTVDNTYTTNEGTITVANGEATFTLKGGETLTVYGIPEGTGYTVAEEDYSANGYETTSTGDSGEIIADETAEAEFTNHRDVGSLTITKNVEGNGEDAPNALTGFEITVTLTAPAGVELVGEWKQGEDGGKVASSNTFTLTDGESVELTGLPTGTSYTITEADYAANGYITDIDTSSGEITDGALSATVTNTMNVGDLSVTKTVTGTGAEAGREFGFTLTLTNDAGVKVDNTYETSEGTITVTNGEATFTLKDGETLTVYGIPEGTGYTVAEEDYSANGYETTSTGDSGEIIADETAEAEFTNHRDVGSLKITKEVEGNGEDAPNALTEFEITVTLTAPAGVELVGEWKQGEDSGKVASSNTFTLTDGESVELTGLPTGTSYTITEADYAANGYITDIDTSSGKITDGALRATVLNTMNVGDLSVLKTVTGSGAETDRDFEFTLTLTNNAGVTVDNTYETSEGELTVTGGKATFTLKGGESLSIYGIPEGTDYTVTEKDPAEHGYLITSTSGEEGTIGTSMSSATFTNTRDIGELSIEKKVEGAIGETDKPFEFELTLTPSGNGIGVDGTYDATLYTAGQEAGTTVTVANGKATFTLTHGQRLVIHEIPATATYEVTEASYALEGYQTEQSGETGTIPATGSMPVATFTNTRNAGSLRIEKVFAGNAPIEGDTFTFTIRLSREDGVNVDLTYDALLNDEPTSIAFTGGEATIGLTGGDVLEILDILSGTAYEVTEEIPEGSGYVGTGENVTGEIPVDEAATATITNERNTGNLVVRKLVAGNAAETDRSFGFTIFLRNPDGVNANGTYPMTGDAGTSITFVDGIAAISLSAGEEAAIQGILAGAYYDVSEDDADTDGYVTTSTATSGLISATADATVTYTNTRNIEPEVTTRTVYKIWNDEDDVDGLRPDELIVYLLADGGSVAAATLNEANGWSAVFEDLPVYNADGTEIDYEVVEAYTAEYYVRYQYEAAVINITNTHNPDEFDPRDPDDPELITLIEDNPIPLGGNVNMNEGDCFN